MDLNELFHRHQLALMTFIKQQSPSSRAAAARLADEYASRIYEKRSAQTRYRVVLSAGTLLALSSERS